MKAIAAVLATFAVAAATVGSTTDAAAQQASATWTVSVDPVLSIGELDGPDEYIFQSIARALALLDDRIAVADGGLKLIRIYDASGDFVLEIGSGGEGPGEFMDIRDMWLDDSGDMGVFDSETLRLTRFGLEGSVRESRFVRPPPSDQLPPGTLQIFLGAFSDGSVGLGWLGGGGRLTSNSTTADRLVLGRFDHEGTFLGLMGEQTFFERVLYAGGGGGPVAFTPVPYWDVHADSLYFTDGLRPVIEVRDGSGNVGRTIAVPAVAADVDAARSALARRLDDDRFATVENLNESPRPKAIPTISGLVVDDNGFVWVRAYEAPEDALWLAGDINRSGGSWWVFDRSGQLAATVVMPAGLRPLDIRSDRIIGVSRDDLDVERVVVHTLGKS
ncbi:MAG: 6-bladed beta-propeller [Gemmatimonadota bacterium]|nr:6-bladed beta-propeller [Gemmatimonadota bacterium]